MLMNWSSPFPEEAKKIPRKKITSAKQLDNVEDEPLSDYVPPPKPERIEKKEKEQNSASFLFSTRRRSSWLAHHSPVRIRGLNRH